MLRLTNPTGTSSPLTTFLSAVASQTAAYLKKKKKDNIYTECLKTPFVFCLTERAFWMHLWVIRPTVQPCVTHESRVDSDGLIKSLSDCLQTGVMLRPTSLPLSGLGVVLILLRASGERPFQQLNFPPVQVKA